MNSHEIEIIFLYEFKLGHSAAKAARNINMAFGEGNPAGRPICRRFPKFSFSDTSLVRNAFSEFINSKIQIFYENEFDAP